MLVRVVESADPRMTYCYLIVKNGVTTEKIQSKIDEIKNDKNFLEEYPDWCFDDIFNRFPKEWDCEMILFNEVVKI